MISAKVIARFTEENLASDPKLMQEFKKKGRFFMSDVRSMIDEEILAKLQSIGFQITRETLGEWCRKEISADNLSKRLIKKWNLKLYGGEDDFSWMGLAVLWERWFPEFPSLEMLDDSMQNGYKLLENGNTIEAMKAWSYSWESIKWLMAQYNIPSIESFDEVFLGTQSIYNWASDFEMEHRNVGIKEPDFLQQRIDFCTEYIERYKNPEEPNIKNMRRAIAETLFLMGKREEGDKLFEQYLSSDPTWGWGWIGWSDEFNFIKGDPNRNPDKAVEILKRGLSVNGLEDKVYVLDRLKDIYNEREMHEEEERIQMEIDELQKKERAALPRNKPYNMSTEIAKPVVTGHKVGRNDPCPCGSGKKYKKCCSGSE